MDPSMDVCTLSIRTKTLFYDRVFMQYVFFYFPFFLVCFSCSASVPNDDGETQLIFVLFFLAFHSCIFILWVIVNVVWNVPVYGSRLKIIMINRIEPLYDERFGAQIVVYDVKKFEFSMFIHETKRRTYRQMFA